MNQDCPLCGSLSIFTQVTVNKKQIKKVSCPQCGELYFDEDTEDRFRSALQQTKDEFADMARNAPYRKGLKLSLNQLLKNSKGESQLKAETLLPPNH